MISFELWWTVAICPPGESAAATDDSGTSKCSKNGPSGVLRSRLHHWPRTCSPSRHVQQVAGDAPAIALERQHDLM
jgi:hypothetical protein